MPADPAHAHIGFGPAFGTDIGVVRPEEPIVPIPGVHIKTLHNPGRYTDAQLDLACAIARLLARGKLVLLESPRR